MSIPWRPSASGPSGYLNAVPLTRGLEEQVTYATPSKLAEMLQRDELDVGLVRVVEVLFHDRYDILGWDCDRLAGRGQKRAAGAPETAKRGNRGLLRPRVAHQRGIAAGAGSAERGLKPEFKPLASSYDFAALPNCALLIGDQALDFSLGPHEHEVWDLGAAWYEMTQPAVCLCRLGLAPRD